MREDRELCTYFRFHKHKIIFFLAAMRTYAGELRRNLPSQLHYETLADEIADEVSYEEAVERFLRERQITKVHIFEIEDKFFEVRILRKLKDLGLDVEIHRSPMFLTSRRKFREYLSTHRRPFMKTFYESQRRRLNVLVDEHGNPAGGRWSFDEENRLALPANVEPPPPPILRGPAPDVVIEVAALCEKQFADHPGQVGDFWLPVDRASAQRWLAHFCESRLAQFGPYEDALAPHSDFVFHSVLTPFLNTGLLTPRDVVTAVLKAAHPKEVPLASLEGFVRQVIGWREFVRGIYRNFSEAQDRLNYFDHQRKLSDAWYRGDTGIPQLDRTLQKVLRYGYCHHIERLMVLGNLMLLLGVHPREAHRWFMEMFVDSSDWVMGPNVYGMALFSDGGVFATKPYICGSNYWRKMSKEKPGDWCDGLDGLYWGFIERHRDLFLKNPRMAMMVRSLDKMDENRKKALRSAAQVWVEKLTRD